jgi:hypothetical protein
MAVIVLDAANGSLARKPRFTLHASGRCPGVRLGVQWRLPCGSVDLGSLAAWLLGCWAPSPQASSPHYLPSMPLERNAAHFLARARSVRPVSLSVKRKVALSPGEHCDAVVLQAEFASPLEPVSFQKAESVECPAYSVS